MKVIRKSDNEIIEVKEWRGSSDVIYSTPDMNEFYQASDLDFDLPKEKAEVIEGWLCREKGEEDFIILHEKEPHIERDFLANSYFYESNGLTYWLPNIFFPSLTYENSPCKVRIQITPME